MKTLLLIIVALSLFLLQTVRGQDHPNPATLEPGSKAPDFSLPATDGKMYSLADFDAHKVLAIIFSCNHCPTAQAYEDRMIALTNDYKDKGVAVVVISPNSPEGVSLSELGYSDMGDDLEDMKIRARDKGYNFPYLFDGETQKTSIAFGPIATPQAFVFDEKRVLRYVGRLDDSEKPGTANAEDMRKAIDELLAGKSVSTPKTKTFGCSTKWGWKKEWKYKELENWGKLPVSVEDIDEAGLKALVKNDGEKLRLINVWATWCGPCVAEFSEFIDIDRMYRHRDFEFVTISSDIPKRKEQVLKFLTKKEASNKNYISLVDNRYTFIEAIDPEWQGALPYTILVEPGGKVVYRQEGMIDPLALKRAIVEHEMMGRFY